MDIAIATFQAYENAMIPKLGQVKPIHIFSSEPRQIDEGTVSNLEISVKRDGSCFHPILVHDKGAAGYCLISGGSRLEASKRCFGEERPIWAWVYPTHTPDELINLLKIEENLFRKQLTAAECQAQTIRWVAACKKLVGSKLATELPVSDAQSAARGGRGKKAWTAQAADALHLSKPAVQKRIDAAEAAIGEEIDLDCDTPEELERKAAELEKADMRQRAEPKAERPKRRKPALCAVIEDATPAESQAREIDSEIEEVWRAFSALSERKQLAIMLRACRLRGWALRMGRARRVPAGDEEPAVTLPLKAAQATYDTAVDSQPEQQEGGADVSADDLQHPGSAVSQAADQEPELAVDLPTEVAPATDAVPMELQAEQQDGAAVVDAGDLPVTGIHVCEAADQEPNGANADAEHLQDAGVKSSEAANQEPGGATKCAYCGEPFSSIDPPEMKCGRLYHQNKCVEWAKPPIAIAA